MTIESSNIGFGMGQGGSSTPLGSLAFRLLAVADLSRVDRGFGEAATAQVHQVDKDNFNDLFEKLAPSLIFQVPNLLLGKDDMTVELEFKSLKDFEPDAIISHIPALNNLRELHQNILSEADRQSDGETLANKVASMTHNAPFAASLVEGIRKVGGSAPKPAAAEPAADSPKEEGGGAIDRLLDMVEGDEPAKPKPASSALSGVISAVVKSAGSGKPAPAKSAAKPTGVRGVIQQFFEEKIGKQVDAIMHHPDFQAFESAWRGLRMLVERTDFRKDVIVEVLAARKQDLRKLLVEQVLDEEYNQPGDPPLGAVICDQTFENTPPDIDLLNEIGDKCQGVQAPFIAQVGAAFLGRKSLQGMGTAGSLQTMFSAGQFAKWRGLRDKEESRWIALTINRILLRLPWKAGDNSKVYNETISDAESYLWGSPAWALGAALTSSAARTGWPHFASGLRDGGAIENLPVRPLELRAGKSVETPLETLLSEAQVQDLASGGLIPVQAMERSDTAFFTFLPSISAAKRYPNAKATQEAAMHAILPYQLFAARISHWLGRLLPQLRGAGLSAEQLQATLAESLRSILVQPNEKPDATKVRVEVSDDDKNPDRYEVFMELQPSFKFFNLTPRLLLTISVGK